MRNVIVLLVFNCVVAFPSHAELVSRRLFTSGSWFVEITKDTDDNSSWCDAATINRSQQIFSVSATSDRSVRVMVFDPSWALSGQPVSYFINVDNNRWPINGTAGKKSVSVYLDPDGQAFNFLNDLAGGSAVTIYNLQERKLAAFSLRGSRESLAELWECWAKIF